MFFNTTVHYNRMFNYNYTFKKIHIQQYLNHQEKDY